MMQSGDTFRGRNGKIYILTEKLGEGGEGAVYRTDEPSLVAKLYKTPTAAAERKIQSMLKHSINLKSPGGIPIITWPQDILYQNGRFAGYIMPFAAGGSPIWKLGRANGREEIFNHQYDWSKALAVAANLASLVLYLHDRGIIIGDMNSNNIFVHPNGYVTIMDVDSFDVRDKDTGEHFKCTVGRPEYLAPELQLRRSLADEASEFTEQTDDFALAVHIFQILFLAHPFNMKMIDRPEGSKGENQQADAIVEGRCPFVQEGQEKNIQPGVPYLSMLPDYLQKDFRETFSYDALNSVKKKNMRTKAGVWYRDLARLYQEKDRTLIRCTADKKHYYLNDGRGCELCRAKRRMDDYNRRMMQWSIQSTCVNRQEDDELTSLQSVSLKDRWYSHYKVNNSPLNMSVPLYVRRTYPNGEATEITQLPKPYRTGDTISIEGSVQRAEQKQAGIYKIELFDSKKQLIHSSSICIVDPKTENKVSGDSRDFSGWGSLRNKNVTPDVSSVPPKTPLMKRGWFQLAAIFAVLMMSFAVSMAVVDHRASSYEHTPTYISTSLSKNSTGADQPTIPQPPRTEAAQEETAQEETTQAETTQAETTQEETTQAETTQEETTWEEVLQAQTEPEQPVNPNFMTGIPERGTVRIVNFTGRAFSGLYIFKTADAGWGSKLFGEFDFERYYVYRPDYIDDTSEWGMAFETDGGRTKFELNNLDPDLIAAGSEIQVIYQDHEYFAEIYSNDPSLDDVVTGQYSEYILPDSDKRYYSEEELSGLSIFQLRIARNELYARHGRRFTSGDLQEYFDSCSWYRGTIMPEDFDEERIFNKYEKANRNLIKIMEES